MTFRTRAGALLAVLALMLAACGQKSGVHDVSTEGGGGGGGGGTASGGTTGGGTTATTAEAAEFPGGLLEPGANDTQGVTPTEIRIGIHGPLTGAGAPATSFTEAKDLYFQASGPINGRTVRVFLEDDKYNPSGAAAACKKLVEVDKVFLLVGAAGADQIAACAKYAADAGVPYLSEGVGETGLGELRSYFATSLTYRQQGVLLAQYMKNVLRAQNVAMVWADTANFQDGHDGFEQGVRDQGLNLDGSKDINIPKDASAGEMNSAAVQVCSGTRPDAVYPLMSPTLFLQLARAMKAQNCNIRFAGIGNTMAINLVAQVGCDNLTAGASFFATYPGLDRAQEIDPQYQATFQRVLGKQGDDIGFGLWAAQKSLAEVLKAAGQDLTRSGFVAALAGKTFPPGVSPGTDFTKSRFGGTAMHVLKADCAAKRWTTEFPFASGF